MERNEIIKKLINEGFTEKTLVNFSDKQLLSLAKRMINEEMVMISKKSPTFQKDLETAKKTNKTIETYEQKEICKNCGKKVCECKKSEVKDGQKIKTKENKVDSNVGKRLSLRKLNEFSKTQKWVEKIVENNYHSLTTKNEIMELIKSKLTESDVMTTQPSTRPSPNTNPSPTVDPNRPKPQKPKRENPFEPGRQPKPKAKTKIPEFMKFDNIGITLKDSK